MQKGDQILEFSKESESHEKGVGEYGCLSNLGDADIDRPVEVLEHPNSGTESITPHIPEGELVGERIVDSHPSTIQKGIHTPLVDTKMTGKQRRTSQFQTSKQSVVTCHGSLEISPDCIETTGGKLFTID